MKIQLIQNIYILANISYDRWIESISDQPVMIIETDYFNIYEDAEAFSDIQKDILKRL